MPARRFPPPWPVEEMDASLVSRSTAIALRRKVRLAYLLFVRNSVSQLSKQKEDRCVSALLWFYQTHAGPRLCRACNWSPGRMHILCLGDRRNEELTIDIAADFRLQPLRSTVQGATRRVELASNQCD